MFLAKSLHTAAMIVALLFALAMVGCPPPNDEGEGETETIMLPGDVPLVMVWIPGGTFMMGRYPGEQDSEDVGDSEDPQHQVAVPGFWMAKYELTKRQWLAVMGTEPWSGEENVLDDVDSPAVYVSWDDAKAFITAINAYTGLTFRLPSEAEWEYACRAGTATRFYWGDDPDYALIGNYAWYWDNCSEDQYAHVVGQKIPNSFGLYDMSGNAWEWCEDNFHYTYVGAPTDGSAWLSDSNSSDFTKYNNIFRGGSWYAHGNLCRSADRWSTHHSFSLSFIGFRLAR